MAHRCANIRFVEPNLTQKLEVYEKALSIFVKEEADVLPMPKKKWKIKDEYVFNLE
jgi:hypothetical protein